MKFGISTQDLEASKLLRGLLNEALHGVESVQKSPAGKLEGRVSQDESLKFTPKPVSCQACYAPVCLFWVL